MQVQHKLVHNIVQMAVEKNEEADATIPPQMRDYKFTGPLRPVYPLSEKREVPAHIPRPDYADHRELAVP